MNKCPTSSAKFCLQWAGRKYILPSILEGFRQKENRNLDRKGNAVFKMKFWLFFLFVGGGEQEKRKKLQEPGKSRRRWKFSENSPRVQKLDSNKTNLSITVRPFFDLRSPPRLPKPSPKKKKREKEIKDREEKAKRTNGERRRRRRRKREKPSRKRKKRGREKRKEKNTRALPIPFSFVFLFFERFQENYFLVFFLNRKTAPLHPFFPASLDIPPFLSFSFLFFPSSFFFLSFSYTLFFYSFP